MLTFEEFQALSIADRIAAPRGTPASALTLA
jgi:hypothetical protein